ncbi:MAG: Hg(II)-responsive transcriptional regulator [Planctomycetaceae bacterium]|nr:Hg(II)-responsive transcriptional regulator [Planctomycetaceae bacterium]
MRTTNLRERRPVINKTNLSSTESMTIGSLAKAAGVNIETIRYYQRIHLVDEPDKPEQGYRRYPASIIDRIRFIKRAQDLGFTLNEITDLLSLNDGNCEQARTIAEHKRELIQRRIEDLNAMQNALTKLIEKCRKNVDGQHHCAIIETLTRSDRR